MAMAKYDANYQPVSTENKWINPNELIFIEDALRVGKATPLINAILDITKHNYDHLASQIAALKARVEKLENVAHTHSDAVHAVAPPHTVHQPKPSMPVRKSYLDGTPISDNDENNDDPWASQDEDAHKDIKF